MREAVCQMTARRIGRRDPAGRQQQVPLCCRTAPEGHRGPHEQGKWRRNGDMIALIGALCGAVGSIARATCGPNIAPLLKLDASKQDAFGTDAKCPGGKLYE